MNRFIVVALAAFFSINLHASSSNPYPHEIKSLEFYDLNIAPLRPGQSDANEVIRVFGATQRLERDKWTFMALYSCSDDPITCSHGPRNDKLSEIMVIPRRRVSLAHYKFPNVFTHGYGGVSEVNITCDVYKDGSGLEYWVVSKDFPFYKKGDLFRIHYGSATP